MNKNVLNKLSKIESKVELAEVKVDLSLIDDMQKAYNLASKELSNASNASKKAIASLDELFTSYRQNAIASKQVNDIYSTMLVQAKDLGIDLPSNIQKLNSDAEMNLKDSQAKMANIQNIKKSL